MFDESLLLSSFDKIKSLIFQEVTILHIAVVYILMYVVYKAFGRYIYFKPQEHASKINRTFLTVSLLVVLVHALSNLATYLPILQEYRWFFTLCMLVIIIAPLSIIIDRIIWKYDRGERSRRDWHYDYLPISKDYYKTSISKSSRSSNGSYESIDSWEEEAVESTRENIHSDALLNTLALLIFIIVSGNWAYESALDYGYLSYIFWLFICLTICGMYFDRSVFSWIRYLEKKIRVLSKRK